MPSAGSFSKNWLNPIQVIAKKGGTHHPGFMKLKWLTALYVLFLALLVFMVDQKKYQFLFRFVRETPYGDKVGHFLLMGFFAFLFNLALSCKKINFGKLYVLAGSIIVVLVVTLEEFSQIFVRYRTFDPGDLLFDYAGIFLFGQVAAYLTKSRLARADKPS